MRVVIIGGNRLRQAFEYLGMVIGGLTWLWHKCGGIFYGGNKACFTGTHHSFGSKIRLGRQRSSLPTKGEAGLGTEEVEREEN